MHNLTQLNQPNLKPEWLRMPDAVKVSGLSRSYLYQLINAGDVKSRSLRSRGQVKGIRLISYDSLMTFIEGSDDSIAPLPWETRVHGKN
jgi:hypothetical protein